MWCKLILPERIVLIVSIKIYVDWHELLRSNFADIKF